MASTPGPNRLAVTTFGLICLLLITLASSCAFSSSRPPGVVLSPLSQRTGSLLGSPTFVGNDRHNGIRRTPTGGGPRSGK